MIARTFAPFFGGSTTIFGSTFAGGRNRGIVHITCGEGPGRTSNDCLVLGSA